MFEITVHGKDGKEETFACHRVIVSEEKGLLFVCKARGIGQHEDVIIPAKTDFAQIINIPSEEEPT